MLFVVVYHEVHKEIHDGFKSVLEFWVLQGSLAEWNIDPFENQF